MLIPLGQRDVYGLKKGCEIKNKSLKLHCLNLSHHLGIYRAQNQLSTTHGNFWRCVLLGHQRDAQFITSLSSWATLVQTVFFNFGLFFGWFFFLPCLTSLFLLHKEATKTKPGKDPTETGSAVTRISYTFFSSDKPSRTARYKIQLQ